MNIEITLFLALGCLMAVQALPRRSFHQRLTHLRRGGELGPSKEDAKGTVEERLDNLESNVKDLDGAVNALFEILYADGDEPDNFSGEDIEGSDGSDDDSASGRSASKRFGSGSGSEYGYDSDSEESESTEESEYNSGSRRSAFKRSGTGSESGYYSGSEDSESSEESEYYSGSGRSALKRFGSGADDDEEESGDDNSWESDSDDSGDWWDESTSRRNVDLIRTLQKLKMLARKLHLRKW